jgi:hypothetical protein
MPSEQAGERELYPEESRFNRWAPDGWTVREVKNAKHVIFEAEQGSKPLLHVEADGVSPLISIQDGRETKLKTSASGSSVESALAEAHLAMEAFRVGIETQQEAEQ